LSGALGNLWGAIAEKFNSMADNARERVVNMISTLVAFMRALPGRLAAALSSLASAVGGAISRGLSSMKSRVTGAFSGAASWLLGIGQSIIDGLISGVTSKISTLTSKLSSLKNTIKNAKGPPSEDAVLLQPIGEMIMGGLIRGIDRGVPGLISTLNSVTGTIAGMRAGLGVDVGANPTAGVAGRRGGLRKIILKVGKREFEAYIEEIADGRIDAADALAWQGA
jgi:phage-related protein